MKKIFILLVIPQLVIVLWSQPTPLTMKNAVEMALAPDGNTKLQLLREAQLAAVARKNTVKGALLPNVDAAITETDFTRNLKAFGFSIPIPGFTSPTLVGPLSNFDIRATVSQSIFDFSAWKRLDAAKANMAVAEAEKEAASNQVADAVARAYLIALRNKSAVDTVKANLELAQKLVRLAENQKEAGTGTGVEVTRAKVQLANEKQRLSVAELEFDAAKLHLMRTIGMDLAVHIELADTLTIPTSAAANMEEAMASAKQYRPDWLAQKRREQAASLNYQAVRAERLPSLGAFADYGALGISPGGALATHTIGASLRIPIFDGGRRDSRRAESAINLRQEAIRTKDFAQQVELEVRLALGAVHASAGQVKVAEEGLALSGQELEQAERRYREGVSNSLELVDAQTRLARARDNRILALYQNNVARIDLATAMGALHRILQ